MRLQGPEVNAGRAECAFRDLKSVQGACWAVWRSCSWQPPWRHYEAEAGAEAGYEAEAGADAGFAGADAGFAGASAFAGVASDFAGAASDFGADAAVVDALDESRASVR